MTLQLNMNKMIENMSAKDRARILIADAHTSVETKGKKQLLSSSEKDKLYHYARKENQTHYLNLVITCYKMVNLILWDLDRAFMMYAMAVGDLQRILQSCFLKGTAEDIFRSVVYDFLTEKHKAIATDEEREKQIDEEANKIFEQSRFNTSILGSFDYFDPPLHEHSYFTTSKGEVHGQPNIQLMDRFMDVVDSVITYNKRKYELTLVQQKAQIEILSDRQIAEVKGYEDAIQDFILLRDLFSMLKLYIKLDIKVQSDNQKAISFISSLKDIASKTALTEENKKECEKRVEDAMRDDL